MNTGKQAVNAALTISLEKRRAGGAPKGNSNAVRHGSYARERALKGHRWDRRTRTYKAIEDKVRDYSKAPGASLTSQKRALLRDAATLEVVLIEPLDVYLAGVKIVKRGGKVIPAVDKRLQLSVQFQDLLKAVGLDKFKRQPRPPWR